LSPFFLPFPLSSSSSFPRPFFSPSRCSPVCSPREPHDLALLAGLSSSFLPLPFLSSSSSSPFSFSPFSSSSPPFYSTFTPRARHVRAAPRRGWCRRGRRAGPPRRHGECHQTQDHHYRIAHRVLPVREGVETDPPGGAGPGRPSGGGYLSFFFSSFFSLTSVS